MDDVPNWLTMLDMATFEKWKRKFSRAPGMEMETIRAMREKERGNIPLKESCTVFSLSLRAFTITKAATIRPISVGMATPSTPRRRINMPMKFPTTLMVFISTETFIMTLVLPMALKTEAEAE